MLDDFIAQVEAFGPRVKRGLDEAEAAPPESRTLEMTLVIAIPEGVMDEFNERLSRLRFEFDM